LQGAVFDFLDAHCECTEGWLEPLLTERGNRKSVVLSIIDVISDNNFEYVHASDMTLGWFHLETQFPMVRFTFLDCLLVVVFVFNS